MGTSPERTIIGGGIYNSGVLTLDHVSVIE
jgi:hypothetical protein